MALWQEKVLVNVDLPSGTTRELELIVDSVSQLSVNMSHVRKTLIARTWVITGFTDRNKS